jgi:hypothetical protein
MEEAMRDKHPFIPAALSVLLGVLCLVFYSSSSFAQNDPFGNVDTCRIVVSQDEKSNRVMASVTVFNDQKLAAMTLPLVYGTGKTPIKCDSIRFQNTRCELFDMKTDLKDTVNQTVLLGLVADMSGQKPPLEKGNGEVARLYFSLPSGAKFQDFYIDTSWIKPFNVLKFVTPDAKGIYPAFDNSRAMIKGGIPLPSATKKKAEIPAKTEKEKEAEKGTKPEGKEGK